MWNENALAPLRWQDVASQLVTHPAGALVRLNPYQVEHPCDAGLVLSVGLPVGQRADYRLDLGDETRLAVQDFGTHYLARLERAPSAAALEKALQETPGTSVVGMIAIGVLAGLALSRSKDGAIAGAAIGGLAALAGVTVANASSSPATSEAAADLASIFAGAGGTGPRRGAGRGTSGRRSPQNKPA
ncbi:MAG: hypothetical protein RL885_27060 [Planctomycetota bacterium]